MLLNRKPKTKLTPAQTLGEAIAAAIKQMAAGLGDLPAMSQHQVKVSIKFGFTKDGALELQPKLFSGSLGISAKYKRTITTTQTLTLTFADQVPTINLSVSPSSPIFDRVSVTLIASVLQPANSSTPPTGEISFFDGIKPLDRKPLKDGFAGLILPSLTPGIHSFTAVFASDERYDSVASTATVMVVTPNLIQH